MGQRLTEAIDEIDQLPISVLNGVAEMLVFTMALLITANVVGRYVLQNPIPNVIAMVEMYFMVGIVFLSLASLEKHDENIEVNIVSKRLPPEVQTAASVVAKILVLGIFAYIFYQAVGRTWELWELNATTHGTFQLPIYLSWGILSVGLLGLCVELVLSIVRGMRQLLPDAGGD